MVKETGVDRSLGITTKNDVLLLQIRCLHSIVSAQTPSADAWNDLAVAFMDHYRLVEANDSLDKYDRVTPSSQSKCFRATQCLRNAITLRSSPLKKAGYWCNLGIVCIMKREIDKAQHCFIRATQLDRHCDKGWCLLALLYLKMELVCVSVKAPMLSVQC